MISVIILILFLIIMLYFVKTQNKETFKINCDNRLKLIDDSKEIYTNKIVKKDILIPKGVLPSNLNKTDKYNILNNFGIKNQKQRQNYSLKLNDDNVISFNSRKLLKNYDSIIDNSFINEKDDLNNLPHIFIISIDNKFQWSYETKYLKNNNRKFYVFYEIIDNCNKEIKLSNFKKLKIDKTINDGKKFNLLVNTYKNRNIYKLEYKENNNKMIRLFVGLLENKKVKVKSDFVILKLNNI